MTMHTNPAPHRDDALDLLEREDLELRQIFSMLQQRRGLSVEERADYGDLARRSSVIWRRVRPRWST
jgi:hypothetical protein